MEKTKQNLFIYRFVQFVSWFVATFIFKRKIIRNELKGKKGPYVIIANHQASLDFVNLIGVVHTPMTFVISQSIYRSSAVKWFMTQMGVIPKQQFQTSIKDIKRMKAVIDQGKVLVIYPAGLMCEDGRSTPIPTATYQFLKWLKTDIYVARTSGTYFSMPKWAKGMRAGRTYMDIYKLFSSSELETMDEQQIKQKTDEALDFDAYRDQERLLVKYKKNDHIDGLQNVLYMCPHCKREFSMRVKEENTIYCEACGYEQYSDEYGFLHRRGDIGQEIRYVSDWSRMIYETQKEMIVSGQQASQSVAVEIHKIDEKKNKFVPVGKGQLSLSPDRYLIEGTVHGEDVQLSGSMATFASLPFGPGKYLEIQHNDDIYRCFPEDGRQVMKLINTVKIYYELNAAAHERV